MPKKLAVNAVSLALDSAQLVHDNLSGAVAIGDTLWVAGDEACGLDRLLRDRHAEGLHFVADGHYPLADYLDLPDSADIEADLEGLAVADGYLWLVGSHGLKRKAPEAGTRCCGQPEAAGHRQSRRQPLPAGAHPAARRRRRRIFAAEKHGRRTLGCHTQGQEKAQRAHCLAGRRSTASAVHGHSRQGQRF